MKQSFSILKKMIIEHWNTLLKVNVLTVLACLPLVTIGPAVLAMNGVLTRLADDRLTGDVMDTFLTIFRQKFRRGLVLELVAGAYLFMMLWCAGLADVLEQENRMVLQGAMALSGCLTGCISVYWVPLLADSDVPAFRGIWDGLLLALSGFPQALVGAGVVYGAMICFWLIYPISVLLYVLILPALAAGISVAMTWPTIDRLFFAESGGV